MNLIFSIRRPFLLKSIAFLFVLGCLFSCSKEVIPSDIDFQRHLVGGTGNFQNTFKIWKLDSMSVDGKAYALTVNQKKYTKKIATLKLAIQGALTSVIFMSGNARIMEC